jgi:hypothetical protein
MSKITKRNSRTGMNNGELKVTSYNKDSYQAVRERIIDGTASLKDLLSIKDKAIDFTKCERKIKTIQLIYSAGSQVGACTVVAGNMFSVKLTENTAETFKKSLKMLKENATHQAYESIWVEGINKYTYKFKDGHYYIYYLVTNEEIKELEDRIAAMDYNSVTLEELQLLQEDLPPFVRAWQESSIDVSKDKDKVFVKQFSDFFKKIEVISTFFKKAMDEITNNFNDLKVLHRAGRVNDMQYKITLPENDKVMPDMLGDVNYAICEAVEEYMNGDLLEMYKRSNRNYYEQFADACLPHPELSLFIQHVYTLCTQAYQENVKIEKDQFADLRNKIYTKAAAYGVKGSEVVEVAVSVAMRYVKEAKVKDEIIIDLGTANVNNYKATKVSNIFPQEYEVLRTNEPIVNKLNIIYIDDNRSIVEGEEIEFVNGRSVDDTVELEEMFTGIAYNKAGELVYDVDVYAYKESKSFITMSTFAEGATPQDKLTDEGEFAASFFETNDQVILTGKKRSNILVANDKRTLVAKIVPSKEFMPNGNATIHTITNIMSFIPNAGKERIFLIEVQ